MGMAEGNKVIWVDPRVCNMNSPQNGNGDRPSSYQVERLDDVRERVARLEGQIQMLKWVLGVLATGMVAVAAASIGALFS